MFVPPQGFRHAATLLLTNGARAIPSGASPETTSMRLEGLARELAGLADDMRAPAGAAEWLIAEFNATIDRLPHSFDRERIRSAGAAILAKVSSRTLEPATRDLFLMYVPEDRLPVAAPLAVELTKRRVSVAFADFEVATEEELRAAVDEGLAIHRAGVVLYTHAFERRHWRLPTENSRIRVLQPADSQSTVEDLTQWWRRLKGSVFK